MNPNAKPDADPNVVLLFDATEGWNQNGGVELLTSENHLGKGATILYCSSVIEFVSTPRFSELMWKEDAPE